MGTLMTRIFMIFTDVFGRLDVGVGNWGTQIEQIFMIGADDLGGVMMYDVGGWKLEECHPDDRRDLMPDM